MTQVRVARFVEVMLGLGLVVAALLIGRVKSASAEIPNAAVLSDDAAKTYKSRIDATNRLLLEERFGIDGI